MSGFWNLLLIILIIIVAILILTSLSKKGGYTAGNPDLSSKIIADVERGNYDQVAIEIKNDPNIVNDVDANGKTLLMYACDNLRPNIVELLLSKGATMHGRDNSGKSAVSYAIDKLNEDPKNCCIIDIILEIINIYTRKESKPINVPQISRPTGLMQQLNRQPKMPPVTESSTLAITEEFRKRKKDAATLLSASLGSRSMPSPAERRPQRPQPSQPSRSIQPPPVVEDIPPQSRQTLRSIPPPPQSRQTLRSIPPPPSPPDDILLPPQSRQTSRSIPPPPPPVVEDNPPQSRQTSSSIPPPPPDDISLPPPEIREPPLSVPKQQSIKSSSSVRTSSAKKSSEVDSGLLNFL